MEEWFTHYGDPKVIIRDNAGSFLSHFFRDYLMSKNIKHHLITPYSPQGNLAERSIQNILALLRVHCRDNATNWHVCLDQLCMALNESFNVSFRERPHFLFLGRDPGNKFKILRPEHRPVEENNAFINLLYAYTLVQQELEKNHAKMDQGRHVSGRITHYNTGDTVYLQKHFVNDRAHKIRYPYIGPYRVVRIAGNTVELLNLASGKVRRASMRQLKLFKASDLNKTDSPNVHRPYPVGVPLDNDNELFDELNDIDVAEVSDLIPSDTTKTNLDIKPLTKTVTEQNDQTKIEPPKHKMVLRARNKQCKTNVIMFECCANN